MITHVVIFWVDKNNTEGASTLKSGCEQLLAKIPGVLEFRFGTPVSSNRGVVDDSFHVGISMTFHTQQDADTYQKHPLHIEFVEKCVKPHVKRFVVYDWQ